MMPYSGRREQWDAHKRAIDLSMDDMDSMDDMNGAVVSGDSAGPDARKASC